MEDAPSLPHLGVARRVAAWTGGPRKPGQRPRLVPVTTPAGPTLTRSLIWSGGTGAQLGEI
jgi:hypothetical protein